MCEGKVRYYKTRKGLFSYLYMVIYTLNYLMLLFCSCRFADTVGSIRTIPCSIWNGTSCWHEWRINQSRGSLCQSAQYITSDECCCCCSCCGCLWKISYGRHAVSVVWVLVHWEELYTSFRAVKYPGYNSAKGLTAWLYHFAAWMEIQICTLKTKNLRVFMYVFGFYPLN